VRFYTADEAKSAIYNCLIPYDDNSMESGNQCKSLDMLQLLERFKLLAGFRSVLFLDPVYYGGIFNTLGRQSISTSGHFRLRKERV